MLESSIEGLDEEDESLDEEDFEESFDEEDIEDED